ELAELGQFVLAPDLRPIRIQVKGTPARPANDLLIRWIVLDRAAAMRAMKLSGSCVVRRVAGRHLPALQNPTREKCSRRVDSSLSRGRRRGSMIVASRSLMRYRRGSRTLRPDLALAERGGKGRYIGTARDEAT